MRAVLLLALVGCSASSLENQVPDAESGTARQASHVRVVSWNIESVGSPTSSQYRAARDVLRRLDADVVTLTEVEGDTDEGWLEDLADELGYDHVRVAYDVGYGEDRGAILSRIALTHAAIYDAPNLSGDYGAHDLTRAIPRVTIDTPTPLTVATSHMKAGNWTDEANFRRAVDGERLAQAAIEGFSGFSPQHDAVVVTGDFNAEYIDPDGPALWTSEPYGLPYSYELGNDLRARMQAGGIDGHPFVPLEQIGLVDAEARQTDGRWYTRPASRRRLDYIFATPGANLVGAEVFNCARDARGVGLEKAGDPLSSSTCADAADHLPVVADFDVGAPAEEPVDTDLPSEPPDTGDPEPPASPLVINEIHADPDGGEGDANCDGMAHYVEDEFVEIVNIGSEPFDLGDAQLSDANTARHVFPTGTVLEPGRALVVYGGGVPSCADVDAQVASSGALGLNNGGDTVEIRDGSFTVLATATYGSEAGANEAIVRSPELSDAGAWVPHSTASTLRYSPGAFADGTPFGGTPVDTGTPSDTDEPADTGTPGDTDEPTDTGTAPTTSPVFLHEVLADPNWMAGDSNCDGLVDTQQDELVELYNPSSAPVDLSGHTLSDGVDVRHVFAVNTFVPAQGFLVVYGGGTPTCAGIENVVASSGGLGLTNTGDTLTFAAPDGTVIDSVTWGTEGGLDVSLTRDPQLDPAAAWVQHTDLSTDAFSPGENAQSAPSAPGTHVLLLNEILADPGSVDGDSTCDGVVSVVDDELVELINAGTAPVDLQGYSLTDAVNVRHVFAAHVLQPGERFVVYGGGTPSCGIAADVASSGALGLSNGGDTVTLFDVAGTEVDSHTYGQSPSDASMVRQPEGDPAGAWVDHTTVSNQPHSAGFPAN